MTCFLCWLMGHKFQEAKGRPGVSDLLVFCCRCANMQSFKIVESLANQEKP